MKNNIDLMSSLDQEPWLTLMVWADRCADNGDTARETVLRWMVENKRAPLRKYYPSNGTRPGAREKWEWRWLHKDQGRHTFHIVQHALWREPKTHRWRRVRAVFKSASEAYTFAVDWLSENLDLIR